MRELFIIVSFCTIFNLPSYAKNNDRKLEVVVVTGERNIDRENFFAMLNAFKEMNIMEITHPEIRDLMGSDRMPLFDVIVFYDMPSKIQLTDEQKERIATFFKEGVPALFLHHSLVSYQNWNEFKEIIGAKYYEEKTVVNDQLVKSGYQHDVAYTVKVVDPKHPITKGMSDFSIYDEVYNNIIINAGVQPILTTDHQLSTPVVGWINSYGKSNIVYLLNGHDKNAFENPNYQKLVENAIRWAFSAN